MAIKIDPFPQHVHLIDLGLLRGEVLRGGAGKLGGEEVLTLSDPEAIIGELL